MVIVTPMNTIGHLGGILGLLLACVLAGQAADQCYQCHSAMDDAAAKAFLRDVHRQKGVTCAGCHGGDPTTEDMEKAMSPAAGFAGIPKGDDISARCASCHADEQKMRSFGSGLPVSQYDHLRQGVHGKPSAGKTGRILQCTTCHGYHGVLSAKNPRSPVHPKRSVTLCSSCHSRASYMRTYNPSLPVDQLEKYRTSVHGRLHGSGDVKVATCVSCHGSHGVFSSKDVRSSVYGTNIPATCRTCHGNAAYMKEYGIPTDQYDKFAASVHGVALLQKNDIGAPACNDCHGNHGAAPPEVESVSRVCGTCHALNADLFAKSPHKPAFDAARLPECETCHGNHEIIAASDRLLGTGQDAVCARCHGPSARPKGFEAAGAMRRGMDSLESAELRAEQLVAEAEQKGMEISEAKFRLRDIRQARLEARTMVHAFNREQFDGVIHKGLVVSVSVASEAQIALDEFVFRRTGLGVATLIITLLVVGLYLLIRRIERPSS